MAFLTEWISNIILFILLAVIIELLLPNSTFQKYAKMVIGLLLIVMILAPVLKILSLNPDDVVGNITVLSSMNDAGIENATEKKKKEIQARQRAYILEQMAVHLEKEAEGELMEKFGFQIDRIDLALDESAADLEESEKWIQKVTVHLAPADSGGISKMKEVETVSIDIEHSNNSIKPPEEKGMDEIAASLAQIWIIPEDKIELVKEGGK
ncbi:stage III sporulation protein AF [Bacillus marinisedimentorum]|uniref:stage III sporulation protein AF n=1 Tax=Bacillus marinisedimentorum TaxID=1821260 RepID=UPI000871D495|nr:stage III sporulation protein AF [Bacillus marinisedimentorum]